jgi:uncharacterized protein YjbI with pentapeptide repeats
MKGKRNLLIGLILGVILGWMMFYLRFPTINIHLQFWVGLVLGVSVIALIQVMRTNWLGAYGKRSKWFWFLSFIAGIAGLIWILELRSFEEKADLQQEHYRRIEEIAKGENAERIQNLIPLMSQLIDQLGHEISADPERRVSEVMIKRVTELSRSLKPHMVEKGSVKFDKAMSPERAQLLHALISLEMNRASFDKIMESAHFAQADLIGADLSGIDLSGIDLHEADLSGANLMGTDFSGASMFGCQLQRAHMDSANFQEADLKRSNMDWADANGAVFIESNLDGADLSSGKFRNAKFQRSSIQWSVAANAIFEGANFSEANMKGTHAHRSNFVGADLVRSNLSRTDFKEADLSEANLDYAGVRVEGWMQKTLDWNVDGLDNVQERYRLEKDTTPGVQFRLIPVSTAP